MSKEEDAINSVRVPSYIVNRIEDKQVPVALLWNDKEVFDRLWNAIGFHLKCHNLKPELREDAGVILCDTVVVVRFFRHPEFAFGFEAGAVLDASHYKRSLISYPINEERQQEIIALADANDAPLRRVKV